MVSNTDSRNFKKFAQKKVAVVLVFEPDGIHFFGPDMERLPEIRDDAVVPQPVQIGAAVYGLIQRADPRVAALLAEEVDRINAGTFAAN